MAGMVAVGWCFVKRGRDVGRLLASDRWVVGEGLPIGMT